MAEHGEQPERVQEMKIATAAWVPVRELSASINPGGHEPENPLSSVDSAGSQEIKRPRNPRTESVADNAEETPGFVHHEYKGREAGSTDETQAELERVPGSSVSPQHRCGKATKR